MSEFRAPVIEDLSRLCPKCGQVNRCAVAQGGNIEDCWCAQITMDASFFTSIEINKQCLCSACVTPKEVED